MTKRFLLVSPLSNRTSAGTWQWRCLDLGKMVGHDRTWTCIWVPGGTRTRNVQILGLAHYPLCDELLYQLSYMAGETSAPEWNCSCSVVATRVDNTEKTTTQVYYHCNLKEWSKFGTIYHNWTYNRELSKNWHGIHPITTGSQIILVLKVDEHLLVSCLLKLNFASFPFMGFARSGQTHIFPT